MINLVLANGGEEDLTQSFAEKRNVSAAAIGALGIANGLAEEGFGTVTPRQFGMIEGFIGAIN